MKHIIVRAAMIATALLLSPAPSVAAESKPAAPADAKAATPVAPEKGAKAKGAAPKAKPVDINSASKAELMKVKGIGEAEAERIITGRPYLSKAHLVTRKIIPHGVYVQISGEIIAIQKPEYMKQASQPGTKK